MSYTVITYKFVVFLGYIYACRPMQFNVDTHTSGGNSYDNNDMKDL